MAISTTLLAFAAAQPVAAAAVTAAALLLAVVVVWRQMPFYQAIERLGGPAGWPLLGHAYIGAFTNKQRVAFFFEQAKTYKRMFRIWLGPTLPTVALYHPELTGQVFKSARNITKGISYMFLHEWLGTGLLTSTGEKWKARRLLITPSFHFDVLKGFVEIFRDQTQTLVEVLAKDADTGRTINVFPIVTRCALDIICESAMGQSVNAQRDPDNAYVSAVLDLSGQVFDRLLSPWLWIDVVYKNLFASGRSYVRNLRTLHTFTRTVIEKRRQQIEEHGAEAVSQSSEGKTRKAFLDMLLTTRDDEGRPLTDDDIHEEVETFMFEGHDTTAAAISWTLFNLAKHPEYQRKVHEELDHVLGERAVPAYDDMQQLDVLESCIKESLRLYPSVPMIARVLEEDLQVDGKVLPKGTQVAILIIAMHRHPDLWGPDAEQFRPERFNEKAQSASSAFDYVPFSAGSRNCVGQKFAQFEERVVLGGILKNYELELDTSVPEPEPSAELILRPSNGVHIKLRKRRAL